MTDETAAPDNFSRLLGHLKEESLAARLVQAHRGADEPNAAISKIIDTRLEEVREELDNAET